MFVNAVQSTIHDTFVSYKKWIRKNPLLLKDIESTMRCVSYLTAGRFNHSAVASELIYSIPNLLVLFNDVLIHNGKTIQMQHNESKIKIWITILEYTDVLLEMSAKNIWGKVGRWSIVIIIQTLKTILRLLLIHIYKARITTSLPLSPIRREKLIEIKEGFTLKRSGMVVRSINTTVPLHARTWVPPCSRIKENVNSEESFRTHRNLLFAETLYVVKPLLHLGCISVTGEKQWHPWLLSFFIDWVSLRMINANAKTVALNSEERGEVFSRKVALLLYLLRSPFYDKYTRAKIYALLKIISSSLPMAKYVVEPWERYLPYWQNIYFYTWSC